MVRSLWSWSPPRPLGKFPPPCPWLLLAPRFLELLPPSTGLRFIKSFRCRSISSLFAWSSSCRLECKNTCDALVLMEVDGRTWMKLLTSAKTPAFPNNIMPSHTHLIQTSPCKLYADEENDPLTLLSPEMHSRPASSPGRWLPPAESQTGPALIGSACTFVGLLSSLY